MKAVGYIRVSTDEQALHGISLEAQRAQVEGYAIARQLELVGIIEDAGKSAKNMQRPGLQKILGMARGKEVDAVITVKLDRMFRNTIDALTTANEFQQRGVALHFINENLDTKSPAGELFFTLIAGFAQMERRLTSERTRTALARKKAKGERYGMVPYGYSCSETGKLIKNAEEQRVLSKIMTMRQHGQSYERIAATLNESGLNLRNGKPWNRVRVYKIAKSTLV